MKILLISDSHLCTGLADVIAKERADINLHLGDSQQMKNNIDMIGFDYAVRGNCDFEKYPEHEIVEVGSEKWLLMHGHQVFNAHDLEELSRYASDFDCEVVCYGHTHVAVYSQVENVKILNPGSFARSRSDYPNSYMIVEITDDVWRVVLKAVSDMKVIEELKING